MDRFSKAMSATHEYLADIGVEVSIRISDMFATCPGAGRWLARIQWPHLKDKTNVVTD